MNRSQFNPVIKPRHYLSLNFELFDCKYISILHENKTKSFCKLFNYTDFLGYYYNGSYIKLLLKIKIKLKLFSALIAFGNELNNEKKYKYSWQ